MKYNYNDKTIKPITEGKPFCIEIRTKTMIDDNPDLSYLSQDYHEIEDIDEREKYRNQDIVRLENYNNSWNTIGIKAYTMIYLPIGNNSFKLQEIDSGGLWGIESDSEKEYIQEIKNEQIDELKGYLKMLNVDIPDNVLIIDED